LVVFGILLCNLNKKFGGIKMGNLTLMDVCGRELTKDERLQIRSSMEKCGVDSAQELQDCKDVNLSRVADADGNLTGQKITNPNLSKSDLEKAKRDALESSVALWNTFQAVGIPQTVGSNDIRVWGSQKAAKLRQLGYDILDSQSYTALDATKDIFTDIARNNPNTKVMFFGLSSLGDALKSAGVEITNNPNIADYLVVGEVGYGKVPTQNELQELYKNAEIIKRNGGKLIAGNGDEFMIHDNEKVPLVGIWFVQEMKKRGLEIDDFCGKPSGQFFQKARIRAYDALNMPLPQEQSICLCDGDYPKMEATSSNLANRLESEKEFSRRCDFFCNTNYTGVTKDDEELKKERGINVPHARSKNHKQMYQNSIRPKVRHALKAKEHDRKNTLARQQEQRHHDRQIAPQRKMQMEGKGKGREK
jgi:ribonucleotide monophosphatase NagD (HAD superfamily)